jgi:oxygen-independent coproporphyrinogen III oxidase
MPLGLYVHIPFCAAICAYCNFNRGLLDEPLKRRYVRAVIAEIHGWATRASDGHGRDRRADTIYFGGGTPSLLDPQEIGAIIGACRAAFDVTPDAEVTVEANPETVDEPRLAGYRSVGVNRLSFGVQSFRDPELRRLGRLHDAARARAAAAEARRAGFDNLSLDLMLWLPEQTLAHLEESLDGLVEVSPEHASVYLLELYPNAPLKEDMARAGWSQAPDDDAADMYLRTMERLESVGYAQYEISNLARPSRQSRHNLKYWTDGEWVGFGCGAHSTVGHVRWNNVAATAEYVQRIEQAASPVAARRALSAREQVEEALFMELRLTAGVDLRRIREAYSVDVWRTWESRLTPFVEAGLLVHTGDRLRLTRTGMLLSNEVMSAFLEAGSTVK